MGSGTRSIHWLGSVIIFIFLLLWLLLNHFHHCLLDLLFLEGQSVLIPDKIRLLWVEAVSLHASFEETNDVSVVWILSEAQASAVVHELSELFWLVLAQLFDRNFLFLFLDVGIFFLLRSSGEALPWKRSSQEVEEHMTNGFEVVSARLLVTDVGVDACVSGCTSEILAITERNVLSV